MSERKSYKSDHRLDVLCSSKWNKQLPFRKCFLSSPTSVEIQKKLWCDLLSISSQSVLISQIVESPPPHPLFLVVAYVFRLVYNYEKIPISGAWDVWNTQDWKHHETGLINSEGCFLYVTALNHVSIRYMFWKCKKNPKQTGFKICCRAFFQVYLNF